MSYDDTHVGSTDTMGIDNNLKSFVLDEVQGDVVFGFSKDKEEFCFFQINEPAEFKLRVAQLDITNGRAVLEKKSEIASCPKGTRIKAPFVNIAFSSKGLKALGLSSDIGEDPSGLRPLQSHGGSDEFRFKAGQLASAKSLGDSGVDKPGAPFDPDWESAFRCDRDIHGLLLVAAESWLTANEKLKEVQDCLGTSIRVVYSLKGSVRPKPHRGHEHFGWLDDVSNPGIKGLGNSGNGDFLPGQMQLDPGVLLCGMEGDPMKEKRPKWAIGSSFLVFRQLAQHVPEFHEFLAVTSATALNDPSPEGAHRLGAHLVGRWKSGAPLQLTPEKDDQKLGKDKYRNNKFDFPQERGDEGQALCPYSSHIRKTNPRADLNRQFGPGTVERHAIRRAGITYGPELTPSEIQEKVTEHERGLAFVCYQSDIAHGFEFMQLTWANAPDFIFGKGFDVGLDPLIGQNSADPERKRETWGAESGPKVRGMPEFVKSRGGEYFVSLPISTLKDLDKCAAAS